jgi:serine/threonine-protein kinase
MGIAHRDVKPANMMVVRARRGEAGLRMLDFGIAKVMEPEEQAGSGHTSTQTELTAFSLLYAAPEQISRSRTGPWTDVHALGLILTEMLTDTQAYQAEDTTQIYAEIVGRERPTPGRAGVDVGPWEAVLAKGLTLRPADRYGNASDFLAALESTIEDAEAAWQSARAMRASLSGKPVAPLQGPATTPDQVKPDTLMGATGAMVSPRRSRLLLPLGALGALSLFAGGLYAVTHTVPAAVPEAHLAQPPARPAPVSPPVAPPTVAAPPAPPAPQAPVAAAPDASVVAPAVTAPVDDRHGRRRRHRERAPSERGNGGGGGIIIE